MNDGQRPERGRRDKRKPRSLGDMKLRSFGCLLALFEKSCLSLCLPWLSKPHMHVAGYMLFDKIQLVAFCCEAQKQPEDVEDVPETANALKQLKSAQGKVVTGGLQNVNSISILGCELPIQNPTNSDILIGGKHPSLQTNTPGEGLWDFEDAEEFSDDEQDSLLMKARKSDPLQLPAVDFLVCQVD